MPAEVMDMFREAQQNILELNKSRLVALEELQLARARIEDLEERCLEAERKAAEATALLAQGAASLHGGGSGAGGIRLRYLSGWNEAFVHFAGDDGVWTEAPGTQMTKVENNTFELSLPTHSKITFVVNNGHGDWDKPGSGSSPNYVIDVPGNYTLRGGTLCEDD